MSPRKGAKARRARFQGELQPVLDGLYRTALRLTRNETLAEDLHLALAGLVVVQHIFVVVDLFPLRLDPGALWKRPIFFLDRLESFDGRGPFPLKTADRGFLLAAAKDEERGRRT